MAASEIEKLERLVRENPKGRQFAILADAYRKDGQYQRALDVLGPGLDHHPDYVSARVVLGRVLMAMGESAKAKEAFTRVVALDPESVIALKALADLAEEQGDGGEALQRASQLLTVDPGNEEAQKQVERLSAANPAPAEVRLSGIVPIDLGATEELPPAPAEAPAAASEATAAPFEAMRPPVVKTKEIPVISVQSLAPSFTPTSEPLEQAPEPIPLMPLSEEAQVERVAGEVQPLAALEPTSFEPPAPGTTTERLAGIDPTGMSESEVAAIGAAPGFEPTSGPLDTTEVPRTSMIGLETIAGEPEASPTGEPLEPPEPPRVSMVGLESIAGEPEGPAAPQASDDIGLEKEQDLEIGASATNEYQEASAAETLRRRSGANEFQVSSDADMLDADAAGGDDAMATGGTDLAFITPDPEPEATPTLAIPAPTPQAPVFTPAPLPPEDPEPAVSEPEPVVTEAMAELYASQGHLHEALAVYHQLAERNPGETRFQDRIVELEMFAGGAPAPEPVAYDAPAPPEPMAPTAPLTPPAVGAPPAREVWDARSTGGKPVGSWLSEVFAESLPRDESTAAPAPAAALEPEPIEMLAPEPAVLPVPEPPPAIAETPLQMMELTPSEPGSAPAAPSGQPTRPASGSFSLTNVFGDERPSSATVKSGSFDDFFGAPAAPAATPPAPAPGSPSIRTTRPSASTPASEDDLSSFQDWLKGLKK